MPAWIGVAVSYYRARRLSCKKEGSPRSLKCWGGVLVWGMVGCPFEDRTPYAHGWDKTTALTGHFARFVAACSRCLSVPMVFSR